MHKINLTPEMRSRRLALCFIDLIGSTAFVQKAGALKAARWLQYHDRLTRSLIHRHQGREIDRSDGFLLSFERISNALEFALEYQAKIPLKTRLQARIGLHLGDVIEVTQHELEIMGGAKPIELEGIAKNTAARIMSLCGPQQILLSHEAYQALRFKNHNPEIRLELMGLYSLKGISAPQRVYAAGSSTQALTPPQGHSKALRLGGPKKVKAHLRHLRFMEKVKWVILRLALIILIILAGFTLKGLLNPAFLNFFDIDHPPWNYPLKLKELINEPLQPPQP